ncbi:MAG TPA: tRNA 2-thiouridine(34) synthase MnmA [Longimicrobiales bacterium]|nr:tRNA 2-thiouridine(34) synthase MnmA [Longimicrobiales bacterium]
MSGPRRETVLVAMSGGVDSSVAAALLVERGYRVIGATMKTFCYAETPARGRTCCGLDGIMDARRVADQLDIPHYVFDMEESFGRAVMDDFVAEYLAGRTPNPCVRCNSNTKIPDLLRRGRALGADLIATGHYARIRRENGAPPMLLRGVDARKDQSYFLWGVPPGVLAHVDFPVGELTKPEVRDRARALGLGTAEKPESQEICFVPTDDYTDFLADRLGPDHPALSPGRMVGPAGEELGMHGGYARYTVGQRKGLGGGFGRRLYVLGVRTASNEVVVGDASRLARDEVGLGDPNWLAARPSVGERLTVRLRHRGALVAAEVLSVDDAGLRLRLRPPQNALTPGQSGALYRGETLIGGGRIR